jgi:hypothetical protein
MNRRDFVKTTGSGIGILALAGSSLFMESCNVMDDIINWVPIGRSAINAIVAVLTGNGVLISPGLADILKLVSAGLDELVAAAKQYKSTTPPPVGALAKIETAFSAVIDNFKTFLTSLNVSGGLLGIIAGLAQIIFSTLAAFMNRLPAASSIRRTVTIGATLKVGNDSFAVIPKERSDHAFKHDFNNFLKSGPSVGVVIPPNAYIHTNWFGF